MMIREPILQELIQAAAAFSATISGRDHGFALVVRFGEAEKVLGTARGSMRLFCLARYSLRICERTRHRAF